MICSHAQIYPKHGSLKTASWTLLAHNFRCWMITWKSHESHMNDHMKVTWKSHESHMTPTSASSTILLPLGQMMCATLCLILSLLRDLRLSKSISWLEWPMFATMQPFFTLSRCLRVTTFFVPEGWVMCVCVIYIQVCVCTCVIYMQVWVCVCTCVCVFTGQNILLVIVLPTMHFRKSWFCKKIFRVIRGWEFCCCSKWTLKW